MNAERLFAAAPQLGVLLLPSPLFSSEDPGLSPIARELF